MSVLLGEFGLEAFPQLFLSLGLPLMSLYFALDAFSRPEDFALQIETAAFLRIVQIKESLEAFCDLFELNVAHLAGPDVEDLAGFVHGDIGAGKGTSTPAIALVGSSELL